MNEWSTEVCSSDREGGGDMEGQEQVREALRQRREREQQRKPGELSTDAAVQAVAEGQVRAGRLALGDEGLGPLTERGIAIDTGDRDQHDVALVNLLVAHHHVLASETRERDLDPQEKAGKLPDAGLHNPRPGAQTARSSPG